jgi:hypothetical protein
MIASGMIHKQVIFNICENVFIILVFKHKNKTDSQRATSEGIKNISQTLFIANVLQSVGSI